MSIICDVEGAYGTRAWEMSMQELLYHWRHLQDRRRRDAVVMISAASWTKTSKEGREDIAESLGLEVE